MLGILLVTAATAWIWSQIAPEQALWITLSVLVISCPCALALATPAALTSAASALRGTGVIVRGENARRAGGVRGARHEVQRLRHGALRRARRPVVHLGLPLNTPVPVYRNAGKE